MNDKNYVFGPSITNAEYHEVDWFGNGFLTFSFNKNSYKPLSRWQKFWMKFFFGSKFK